MALAMSDGDRVRVKGTPLAAEQVVQPFIFRGSIGTTRTARRDISDGVRYS